MKIKQYLWCVEYEGDTLTATFDSWQIWTYRELCDAQIDGDKRILQAYPLVNGDQYQKAPITTLLEPGWDSVPVHNLDAS